MLINTLKCLILYKKQQLIQEDLNLMQRLDPEGAKLIDVEKVIGDKNPRLLKVMPSFVINYFKKLLHQDRLNQLINTHRTKQGVEFLDAMISEFNINLQIKGIANYNPSTNYVVVSNHPLGGLDGMALMLAIGKVNPNLAITANDFLMHIDNLKTLFIPVNKHGSNAENIAYFEETFASEKVVIFFPAGLCSRKTGDQILDLEWKKTFLTKARKYKREILPVHISGRNSNFFYNLANLRKKLGIKLNIEMLFLVDEMFKQSNKDVVISFGKSIPIDFFDKRLNDKAWTKQLRKHVYDLSLNLNAEFSPIID